MNRRLLLLGAFGLAAGAGADDSLEGVLAQLGDQEKVLSTVVLALGPRRHRSMEPLARLTSRDEKMVVRIGAYAALSRFEADVPQLVSRGDRADPGLFSAALLAGLRPRAGELESWFRTGDRRREHAHLVWRGFLLADRTPDPDRNERMARARQVLAGATESFPEIRDARRAAALCLARFGDPEVVLAEIGRPSPELLVLFAASPEMRRIMPAEWFPPVPAVAVGDDDERRRLAVIYALKQPVADVLDAAEQWTRDEEVRGPLCLALAWRILGGEPVGAPIPEAVSTVPEGAWVRWAAGEQAALSPTFDDRVLSQAASLAVAGRLPGDGARQVLEQSLWRSRSHPALGQVEARVRLLRDLLLSGSIHVSATLDFSPNDRYLARGIPGSDREFFRIAYDYLSFAAVPTLVPPDLRFR